MCAPGLDKLLWQKKLHKLNIFHVNDIWQYGTVDNDDDDEDGEEPP